MITKSLPLSEIKKKLDGITDENNPFIKELHIDDRVGAQKLLQTWNRKKEKQHELEKMFYEMRTYEEDLWKEGYHYIGGVDEVGRGPLAGPVVASCVILSPEFYLAGLTDSKQLSKQKREEFYCNIMEEAISVGIGIATSEEIDQINIYEATKLAMKRAIHKLSIEPSYLLLDAMKLPIGLPQMSLIKGDTKSVSIAASSVIAKVTRDNYMEEIAQTYPEYRFQKNMGYGTKEHLHAIEQHGITKEHRRSFAPVKESLSLF
ncbi:ribonuclease HII [Evansella cellulosilytica]|uniref:Ribonuclease HII n=1 Tax=Evansella cellulosilytica (strain ATCC 21833 / DSM 2522 / FERM P-1141 / JCM 9156 / N-4) TaxID=649639 RepID=E6TSY4_EVAC2|nr:ribonuclease HII [Evansella cellulosilytica]ADU30776.1 Ribonuclease H [Evansella cellulosilytica DSM 2522]